MFVFKEKVPKHFQKKIACDALFVNNLKEIVELCVEHFLNCDLKKSRALF